MSYVLTLVADRTATSLSAAVIERVRASVGGGQPDVLAPGEAADIPCPAAPDAALIDRALEGAQIDAIVSRHRGRRKGLLVADMDSTIVTSETLDELAAFAGLKEQVAYITRRSMNGEVDFTEALRLRVAMLKGLGLDALEKTWARTKLMPGAKELIATMRKHNATTALVSGGFTFFTGRVAAQLGFDIHRANELLHDGEQLTGEVGYPIVDRDTKLNTLRELAAARNLKLAATMAVGDGANDLAMLLEAGLGVAYHAKPVVAALVPARVEHGNLRALLFAQGYRLSDIVSD